MSRYLLDTHTFLWAACDDPALSPAARAVFADQDAVLLLSVASIWEMAIKAGIGKLTLGAPLQEIIAAEVPRLRLLVQRIEPSHAMAVQDLPPHHRDPFDRLLIAQCLDADLQILSRDAAMDAYGVRRVW